MPQCEGTVRHLQLQYSRPLLPPSPIANIEMGKGSREGEKRSRLQSGVTLQEFCLPRLSALIPLAAAALLSACASAPTRSTSHSSSDRVTSAEIATAGASNALELITRLRPNWLRQPTTGSLGAGIHNQVIVVYLDGHRLGDVTSLRTLSADGIRSMQWLDAIRAATVLTEVGSDAIAGAILIKTH